NRERDSTVLDMAPSDRQAPRRLISLAPDAERTDRPLDVLQPLFSHVLEAQPELVVDMVSHRLRDDDPASLRQAFEARCDNDAIAEDIVVVVDYIAEVDADAEQGGLVWRIVVTQLGDSMLDFARAPHRLDNTDELRQEPVAGRLDQRPAMCRDPRLDHLAEQRREPRMRRFFVA